MLAKILRTLLIFVCVFVPYSAVAAGICCSRSTAATKSTCNAVAKIPRSEYPRPQFERKDWLCLNGQWEFEIDPGDSGLERGILKRPLKDKIIVPFCPESKLSGIGNTDFLNAVWYRRTVTIPKDWEGRKVLLHFQGVDYETTVWVNDVEVFSDVEFGKRLEASLPAGTYTIEIYSDDLGAFVDSMKVESAKIPAGVDVDIHAKFSAEKTPILKVKIK